MLALTGHTDQIYSMAWSQCGRSKLFKILNIFKFKHLNTKSVSEFNKLKPRLKFPQKPVSIERRLKSWKIVYNFKWNEPYLSRGSNSLNSVSVWFPKQINKNKFQVGSL